MSPVQQLLDSPRELDGNQRIVREMVLESYRDITSGEGRDRNEFMLTDSKKKILNLLETEM